MSLEILLSTYNGEKHISEFLESLLTQTYSEFHLLIRDDGSTDNTLSIIEEYKDKFDGRIRIVTVPEENVGPAKSFSALMAESNADYVLFADQDDIWLPNKIQRLYDEMLHAESRYPEMPVLVQCDLEVVDENLNRISPSFWQFQGLDVSRNSLPNLVIQNTITGCAVMINRKLVTQAGDVPDSAIMHDWWVGLVAAAFGRIVSVPEALVRYRQHGLNSVGAKEYGLSYFGERILEMLSNRDFSLTRRSIEDSRKQASAFLDTYRSLLSMEDKDVLEKFVLLPSMSWFRRRYFLLKHGMLKHGLMRNLALFMFV